ncbi:MAG: aminotransferase class V-fold PLP-dependent enzyme, partial [Clostridiales bacterium]|nr:aminotransferase class V-fold PLP-dependent enzyme [Clostridiales bacterium]
ERIAHLAKLKSYLKMLIIDNIPDLRVNTPQNSLPSILNISFLGCRGEVLLHSLEADGIYVSTGAACSSKSKGSHVLSAMGLSQEEVEGALRFSFSEENSVKQMEYVVDKLKAAVRSQRKLRRGFRKG